MPSHNHENLSEQLIVHPPLPRSHNFPLTSKTSIIPVRIFAWWWFRNRRNGICVGGQHKTWCILVDTVVNTGRLLSSATTGKIKLILGKMIGFNCECSRWRVGMIIIGRGGGVCAARVGGCGSWFAEVEVAGLDHAGFEADEEIFNGGNADCENA